MSINNDQAAPKKRGFAAWPPEKRSEIMRNAARRQPVRGFALMEKERQAHIAQRGGRSAHKKKRAHEWDAKEAAAAGHLGGLASAATRRVRAEAIEEAIREILSEARATETSLNVQQAALRLVRRLEAKGIVLSFDRAAGRLIRRDRERVLQRKSEQCVEEGVQG